MRFRVLPLLALVLVPHAVWSQGNPVGPEFRVNSYTTNLQALPSIAASSSSFVVVWTSLGEDGSGYGVFGQRFATSGTPLGPEFRVDTFTSSNQYLATVAADPSGNFVVAWNSNDGAHYGVFGQRYASSGVPLGAAFLVNTYTSGIAAVPAIAADASGNFVVTWMSYGQDGSDWGIYGRRFAASGTPMGPEFRVNSFTTGYQGRPVVAAAAAGSFVVAWNSNAQDGSSIGVFGQRFASTGAPLGSEFRVNTYVPGAQYGPSIADLAGGFVVTWRSFGQDGSSNGNFGQRFASSGAPAGPEFRVNTFTTGYQAYPSVASDASGNFVVAWNSFAQDGSGFGIFGQRYAASGAPLGPEFRVNTFVTGYQTYPVAASDAAGNFVVAWQSALQDGSDFGVYAQRYAQIVPVELMHVGIE